MKKLIIALAFAAFVLPTLALAKDSRVTLAENWLTTLTTAKARFAQRGYDGIVRRGNFYLSRPGRLRFEYDGPTRDLVVADGTFIHFYDAEQRQTSTAPIGTTLADFFLRANPKLEGDLRVGEITETKTDLMMQITQSADASAGQIYLHFTKQPFNLKSWRIIDAQGLQTDIILDDLQTGMPISPSLFVFKDPSGRGQLND